MEEREKIYKLSPMSDEQKHIVETVKDNYNVIIDSIAGSGKTTTCLHICEQNPQKSILVLTYNSKLKIETREKVKLLNLIGVEVHSYHAFCVKYYYDKAYNDDGVDKVVRDDYKPIKAFSYDIIMLDEVQDVTNLLYKLIRKIMNDNLKEAQICSFGDVNQNIYTYAGSDYRYLTLSHLVFIKNNANTTSNHNGWRSLKMTLSYRITNQIANFVNKNLLKTDRLTAQKNGPKIKYLVTNAFDSNIVAKGIDTFLKMGKYKPDDIFILGPSLKKNQSTSHICKLENRLVSLGIPCYASNSDDVKLDSETLQGKVCFATFNQTKGSERPICFVYGFDNSYFDYYAKDEDPTICPNILYVALTRASERLILIHHYKNRYLPFIDTHVLKETCDVVIDKRYERHFKQTVDNKECRLKVQTEGNIDENVFIKDLIRNISNERMKTIFNLINYKVNKGIRPINLTSKINIDDNYCENVADLNGRAIPMIYEYCKTKKITVLKRLVKYVNNDDNCVYDSTFMLPSNHKTMINNIYQKLKQNKHNNDFKLELCDVLYIANIHSSLISGFIWRREKITNYNWLDKDIDSVEKALNIMNKRIKGDIIFEYTVSKIMDKKKLIGTIDAIELDIGVTQDKETIWQYKCVNEISKEHILQLVICAYLYENSKTDKSFQREYKLLNILSGEVVEFIYDISCNKIMDMLLNRSKVKKITDDEFIKSCIN